MFRHVSNRLDDQSQKAFRHRQISECLHAVSASDHLIDPQTVSPRAIIFRMTSGIVHQQNFILTFRFQLLKWKKMATSDAGFLGDVR